MRWIRISSVGTAAPSAIPTRIRKAVRAGTPGDSPQSSVATPQPIRPPKISHLALTYWPKRALGICSGT